MLSLVTATQLRPATENLDRDPGIFSLIAAFTRFMAGRTAAAARSLRSFNQRANEAEVFSSSTAWPYNHRSN